jgi:hypothetical protein
VIQPERLQLARSVEGVLQSLSRMANNSSHERKSGEFFKKRDAGTADPPTSSGAIPERPKAQAADHVEPDLDLWEQAYTILKDDPETEKLMKTYHKILKSESNSLSSAEAMSRYLFLGCPDLTWRSK